MNDNKTTTARPRKLRGTATIGSDDTFEFKPYAEGQPTQRDVREVKGGKVYSTCGEKNPLRVAYLTAPESCPDLWSEYMEQLARLGIKPLKEPKQLPSSQRVMNESDMQAWLNQKEQRLTFTGVIDLGRSNWQAEVMRLMQLLVRTLPGEKKFNETLKKINSKRGK